MPTRAPKRCTTPGCPHPQTPDTGRCTRHTQRAEHQRPNSHQRGYNRKWETTSRQYRTTHPTCECTLPGCHGPATCTAPSQHVDHIDGHKPHDPDGHNPEHLQALCHPCHSTKTARHDGGFGNLKGGG